MPKPLVQTEVETMQAIEESAALNVQSHAGDRVRVIRSVETDSRNETVQLSDWRVEVTRHVMDAVFDTPPQPRTEGETTILPVLEEVVETRTVYRLVEEVHIRRVRVERTEEHCIETRHHRVHVERTPRETIPPKSEDSP